MKKLLLILSVTLTALSSNTFAQCTPGANFADSTYGVWPDTIQNFPAAIVGVAYSTDLNFKVPTDAGDVDPNFAGATIQSFKVTDVQGLPPGMTYACNIGTCNYNGGANGCAAITGTCNTPGIYEIEVFVLGKVIVVPGFPAADYPTSFRGYKIAVGYAGIEENKFDNVQLFPNPVMNELEISGLGENGCTVSILNASGKLISRGTNNSTTKKVDVSTLESGIYLVKLEGENSVRTLKFIKQ